MWTKRGSKFSQRASGSATESLHTAILTIKNFQHDDLGVYICKAKSIDSRFPASTHNLKGELLYYLMSSQFGFSSSEQLLLGPDIQIEQSCIDSCRFGNQMMLKCHIQNFDTDFPELKVNLMEWRRVDGNESEDLEIIKDGRPQGKYESAYFKSLRLDLNKK